MRETEQSQVVGQSPSQWTQMTELVQKGNLISKIQG